MYRWISNSQRPHSPQCHSRSAEHGPIGPPTSDKRPRTAPPSPVEALAIHTQASAEPERKQLEAVDSVEEIYLAKEHPKRTLKTKRTKTNEDRRTSDVRVLIITILTHHSLITFIIRSHGLTVKRRSLLIALTVFIKHGWNKILQLRVLILGPSRTAVLDVLNVPLQVAFFSKRVRGQGYQEFSKEFCAVLRPALIALMLSLSHPLSSCSGLGLYFGVAYSN
ncbi:hypothetical protein Cgig2_031919 [Carnegiea gigantea]|uniref:Uncharacterized protein n=1 Tax=Carnegiea gigantea TaxID=171969 RepID=A0A9Q1GL13_9CARY|nr:hypothetical protein Cgig2_031919 [Carnegiea gigantea]